MGSLCDPIKYASLWGHCLTYIYIRVYLPYPLWGWCANQERGQAGGLISIFLHFNFPLPSKLQQSLDGYELVEGLFIMGYADDVALLSLSSESVSQLLTLTADYLKSVRMTLSVGKCLGFFLQCRKMLGFGLHAACCAQWAHLFSCHGGGVHQSRCYLCARIGVFQSQTPQHSH